MPDFSTLLIFAVACLPLVLSPGPDMLLIASRSAAQGRMAGWASLIGIQIGTYCHALAAALGLSALLATVPVAYDVLRVLGALYLFWLAWQTVRSQSAGFSVEEGGTKAPFMTIVGQGFLTNLFNPKVALFVLAFFPPFVRPEAGSIIVQMLVLATVINLAGLVVKGTVILMAGELGRFLSRNSGAVTVQKWFLASVFAGLGLKLLFDTRR